MEFEIDGKRFKLSLAVTSIDGKPIDMDAYFCCPHCGKKIFEEGNFSVQRNDHLSKEIGREIFKLRCSCPDDRDSQINISLEK